MDNSEEILTENVVNIMFCAAPKIPLLLDKSKVFYNIFCFYYPKFDKYVLFFKIYKTTKRKRKNGLYFTTYKSFNRTYSYKEEVFGSLNKFLFQFPEHERFINEEVLDNSEMTAIEAVDTINEWEINLLKYFNETIPDFN